MILALLLLASPAHADGANDYATLCVSCHGENGQGDGPAAAALDPKPANFSDPAFWAERDDDTVKKAIKEGGAAVGKSPLMAPMGASMSDEQLNALVAYLKTLKTE